MNAEQKIRIVKALPGAMVLATVFGFLGWMAINGDYFAAVAGGILFVVGIVTAFIWPRGYA